MYPFIYYIYNVEYQYMAIDIYALLQKNPITKKMLQPKFGYKYLGPYNNLDRQMLYDKQTGDILKYYDNPKIF